MLSNKPPTPKSLNHQISEGSIVVVYIELGDVGLPKGGKSRERSTEQKLDRIVAKAALEAKEKAKKTKLTI